MSSPSSSVTAIVSALAEEQHGLIGLLRSPQKTACAGRDFWAGTLHGQSVVLVLSKIGKVAAATTAAVLVERFAVQRVVFTGVAGGLGPDVQIADLVVASDFVQHDMDASPLFARYEIPLYARTRFPADPALTGLLVRAARSMLAESPPSALFPQSRVHLGLVASGDRFVCGVGEAAALHTGLASAGHDVLAVEMEGAAVAQVCHDYGIPFAAVRTISDRADATAHLDFTAFIADVASPYALALMARFLTML
jgi:adenosylhomocysteine nucleosidase